jgi:hypothetical protein
LLFFNSYFTGLLVTVVVDKHTKFHISIPGNARMSDLRRKFIEMNRHSIRNDGYTDSNEIRDQLEWPIFFWKSIELQDSLQIKLIPEPAIIYAVSERYRRTYLSSLPTESRLHIPDLHSL